MRIRRPHARANPVRAAANFAIDFTSPLISVDEIDQYPLPLSAIHPKPCLVRKD